MTVPESPGTGSSKADSSTDAADGTDGAEGTEGTEGTDDIIDAEIVETPEAPVAGASSAPGPAPAEPPAAPTEPPAAPTGPPAAQAASAPHTTAGTAPVWGSPAVPSVSADPATDYTDAGVPTLAYLQDKVEKRYATALGSQELAEATIPQVADAAKRREELARSAQERLEEIRRSLHPDAPGESGSPKG